MGSAKRCRRPIGEKQDYRGFGPQERSAPVSESACGRWWDAGMVDSEVSRLKFDREVQTLGEQRTTLEARGIFLLDSTSYPFVELAFVPRHLLQVLIPAVQTGAIILPQGAMMAVEIPSVAARAFKARFDLTGYDLQAPSLEFLDF